MRQEFAELQRKLRDAPAELSICVVGLGYVGLPLAIEFSKHHRVTGFDISRDRIARLRSGEDPLGIYTPADIKRIRYASDVHEVPPVDVFIVAVPTDIDRAKQPDLHPFKTAAAVVCDLIHPGNCVIVESTVYPGCTEEIFLPIVERSGLRRSEDFWFGFSPERIVPGRPTKEKGDLHGSEHTLTNTVKVVSGGCPDALDFVAGLYTRIIAAGVHRARTVAIAEAAKILENTQRDLNIALMNEFALICDRIGVDTQEVIDAAATKWNFMPFRPGLVGGHCIGVDPYYLAYQAQRHNFHPQVILAGRQINDRMGVYVGRKAAQMAVAAGRTAAPVLVLGAAFKENCDDLRNSRVQEIVDEIRAYGLEVLVLDELVDQDRLEQTYGISQCITTKEALATECGAVVLAVAHQVFLESPWSEFLAKHLKDGGILLDVKGAYRNSAIMHLAQPGRAWHL